MTVPVLDSHAYGFQGYGGSITHNHTVGSGSNRLLLAFVTVKGTGNAADVVNGVSYGGVPMTALGISQVNSGACIYGYYMIAPPTGTAQVLTQFNTASTAGNCQTSSWNLVDQSAPFFDKISRYDAFASANESITVNTTQDAMAIDAIAFPDTFPTSLTPAAGQTILDAMGNGGSPLNGTSQLETSYKAGGTVMSWTLGSNSMPCARMAVSLKPASATAPTDTTAPTMTGALTKSNVTQNGFTIDWSGTTRSDNVAITGYQYQLDSLGYADAGTATSQVFSGLSAGSTYTITVRAYDAAGNYSAPLSISVTTAAAPAASANIAIAFPMKAVTTDAIRANETGVKVAVLDYTTSALVALVTGLTTDANGIIPSFVVPNAVAGTQYRCIIIFSDNADGMEWATAS